MVSYSLIRRVQVNHKAFMSSYEEIYKIRFYMENKKMIGTRSLSRG